MRESAYQSKIIKYIKSIGGDAFTGMFPTGEADIVAGWPSDGKLLYLRIEVKTEKDYNRVVKGVSEVKNRYVIQPINSLKNHEPLQIAKINRIRDRGGLALIAWDITQVIDYTNK